MNRATDKAATGPGEGTMQTTSFHRSNIRIIARLDVKAPHLIKGINLEGLRKIGDPNAFARRYYDAGIDEILYMDAVASLYGRNSILDVVEATTRDIFVPITVGGGIRSVDDARAAFRAGADKVAVNSAACARPELIGELAQTFGAQAVVLSVEAKRMGPGSWMSYTDNGREPSGRDVVGWAQQAVALGAGEVLLTSVDQEGTGLGYDCPLVAAVTAAVSVPVIASGGMGRLDHLKDVTADAGADAVAIADMLHWERVQVAEVRAYLAEIGLPVRSL